MFFTVPPHQILVYDASGRDVTGVVGPLYEGDNLVLTCEIRGGKIISTIIHYFARDVLILIGIKHDTVTNPAYCSQRIYKY